jgi:hypothetical protein
MVVHRIARWSLSITMLFAGFAAVAQTNSPAPNAGDGGKFRAACGEDVPRFCVGVQPGGGRLVSRHGRKSSRKTRDERQGHDRRRAPDGAKMRVTSESWVILRDQVLEMRNVDGRLHIASPGSQAGRVGGVRSSATSRLLRARA